MTVKKKPATKKKPVAKDKVKTFAQLRKEFINFLETATDGEVLYAMGGDYNDEHSNSVLSTFASDSAICFERDQVLKDAALAKGIHKLATDLGYGPGNIDDFLENVSCFGDLINISKGEL